MPTGKCLHESCQKNDVELFLMVDIDAMFCLPCSRGPCNDCGKHISHFANYGSRMDCRINGELFCPTCFSSSPLGHPV